MRIRAFLKRHPGVVLVTPSERAQAGHLKSVYGGKVVLGVKQATGVSPDKGLFRIRIAHEDRDDHLP